MKAVISLNLYSLKPSLLGPKLRGRSNSKPKVVWVGSTPITPITAKERKKLHRLMKKRLEMRRKKYPEVRGKVVERYLLSELDRNNIDRHIECQ